MSIIPKFILDKIYVVGSLRETADGIAFDFINRIGPGILTRLNKIMINDIEFSPQDILLIIGDKLFAGHEITDQNPALVCHNQKSTCLLKGGKLVQGLQTITIDLFSREAGKIVVKIQDQYHSSSA